MKQLIVDYLPFEILQEQISETMQEKNDKGSWFGWNIEVEKPVTEQLQYETARSFHEGVSKDQVKLAPPSKTESSESETTGDF